MSGLQDTDLDDDLPPPPAGPGLFGDEPAALPVQPVPTPYRVLARKYRPTTFADLIGQEAMVRILRNAFAQNRVARLYAAGRGLPKNPVEAAAWNLAAAAQGLSDAWLDQTLTGLSLEERTRAEQMASERANVK